MNSMPSALVFLLMIFAGWVNRQQLIVIEYLKAENGLLRERLKGRRLRFTDAERALLARKAQAVGRKALRAPLEDCPGPVPEYLFDQRLSW